MNQQNRTMTTASRLPQPFDAQSFSVAEALQSGVTRQRLRAADLRAPTRGVRIHAATAEDLIARCEAYVRVLPDVVVSHSTAARLWSICLPFRFQEENVIHLTRQPPRRGPRRRGVVGHVLRMEDDDIHHGHFVNATTAVRTWFDLASQLSLDELVMAGDHLVRRQDPDATVAELEAMVVKMGGMPQAARARSALGLVRPNTDSPKETQLRLALIRAGLPEPEINVPLRDELGHYVQTPDMTLREHRLLLQYDGGHHLKEEQRRWDISRDEDAMALGWRVMKFTAHDFRHGPNRRPKAVDRVESALLDRGWSRAA